MSAEALAEVESPDTQAPEPSDVGRSYKHLSNKQIALMLSLVDSGKSQQETARILGVGDATVSRTLADFSDTREIARKRLEASALKLVETVATTKDAAVALKALGKLDVVREDQPLSPPALLGGAFACAPGYDRAKGSGNRPNNASVR